MAIQIGHANDFTYDNNKKAIRKEYTITIQNNGTINCFNIKNKLVLIYFRDFGNLK